MNSLAIAGNARPLTARIAGLLARPGSGWEVRVVDDPHEWELETRSERFQAAVYLACGGGPQNPGPDLDDARRFLDGCARRKVERVVLVSSAAVLEPSAHQPGMASESRVLTSRSGNGIARRWRQLESMADKLAPNLSVLRCPPVCVFGGTDYFDRLFSSRVSVTLPGHDPSLQLLSPADLAAAIGLTLTNAAAQRRLFNLAPVSPIPLTKAVRLAGASRLPIPRTLQRPVRHLLKAAGLCYPGDQLDYIRFLWSVSAEKARRELGFSPKWTSAQALAEARRGDVILGGDSAAQPSQPGAGDGSAKETPAPGRFDDFGMDREYIDRLGRSFFRFLHDRYWRIEEKGWRNLPEKGPVVLVGLHRGFMPFDAIMVLHALASKTNLTPRFLVHPGLVKFPFFFNFITKIGGVYACQRNADRILRQGGALGVFPEGVRGAFTLYKDAYRVGRFGRDEFVRLAILHRAPIVPFVTVGSAESLPILARIEWKWWRRYAEWPCIPITPTFPWLPFPLPSKWHTVFLPAIDVVDRFSKQASGDPKVVRRVSQEVKSAMQKATDWILERRRSIFFGSVFSGVSSGPWNERRP